VKKFVNNFFQKNANIAIVVPICRDANSRVEVGISITFPRIIRCALLDIGSSSENP
jgi:hypothetical protein